MFDSLKKRIAGIRKKAAELPDEALEAPVEAAPVVETVEEPKVESKPLTRKEQRKLRKVAPPKEASPALCTGGQELGLANRPEVSPTERISSGHEFARRSWW